MGWVNGLPGPDLDIVVFKLYCRITTLQIQCKLFVCISCLFSVTLYQGFQKCVLEVEFKPAEMKL